MGQKNQRLQPEMPSGSRNIGDMLQRQTQPKLATPEDHVTSKARLDRSSTGPPQQIPREEPMTPDTHRRSEPVTKQDFDNLVAEIKYLLAADVAIIKADMKAIADRIKTSEECNTGLCATAAGLSTGLINPLCST
ncbi:Hypothetical predicted protein [Pelobates cultripes]|uniref:Uncharacterized protein n=1 Tax=Pelobates cultripes TaxID=61616 RepID=A0AAD1VQ69_PELCU|nr:Hypothetical predicted protein [Pelobates cultripes]